ncbi:MAG: ATP-binding cassette domain-containing protein [Oscillospiraceae bacterium]|jgi:oligopeptide/dipeptide ABC transporter ATP-binding protein|nr:ATP-binding cassette domain-containing protein [Oscillospiraceae bacterium]
MEALIRAEDLKKYYVHKRDVFGRAQKTIRAVDGVSLEVRRGETLGVVGESGCGKSTLGRTLIKLLEPDGGRIIFGGEDIAGLKYRDMRKHRTSLQLIFQDPYASLNPRKTVFAAVREPLDVAKLGTAAERRELAEGILATVGLTSRQFYKFPYEMSGGQRQRVAIARSVITNPAFIVCDEPVSALDASIRAQVLNLLCEIQEEKKLTYMFISHDMSVIRHVSDRVMVMYLGKAVELAKKRELFENPVFPYTKVLLSAIPVPDVDVRVRRMTLEGELGSPLDPPPGCRLCARCPHAAKICGESDPELRDIGGGHFVACHRAEQL